MYIEAYGNKLSILMNECHFSEGYASIDGSAFYINPLNSQLIYNCNNCYFENLFVSALNSYAIMIV